MDLPTRVARTPARGAGYGSLRVARHGTPEACSGTAGRDPNELPALIGAESRLHQQADGLVRVVFLPQGRRAREHTVTL